MHIGIIGDGAISRHVSRTIIERGHSLAGILLRPEHQAHRTATSYTYVTSVAELPEGIDHMIDCAGHAALRMHGPEILRRGIDLTTVSIGALADTQLERALEQAAIAGDSILHLASGAVGALDCLQAARQGDLHSVSYVGRKPPAGWKGSPAETRIDLDDLAAGAQRHFAGSARSAALDYPKNANVVAAIALAGIGFDETQVELISDPGLSENIHTIRATGDFGSFTFEIKGHALPDNPRSSALAAMSAVSKLEQQTQRIRF
ncbi:MAG: aspartate dehydrogenase [Woeseiaceae bacterium]